MQRNLDRRVECLAPVDGSVLIAVRLEEILTAALADDLLAWELGPDGWKKVETSVGIDSQSLLETLAMERVGDGR